MRQQSTAGISACQTPRAISPSYPCEWASPKQISDFFGFTTRWYRYHVRGLLQAANVPTRRVSAGPRGLRWHMPTVDAVLSQEAGAR